MTTKLKQANVADLMAVDFYYQNGTTSQSLYPSFSSTFALSQTGYTGPRPALNVSPVPVHPYDLYKQELSLKRDFLAKFEPHTGYDRIQIDNGGAINSSNGAPSETFCTMTPKTMSWDDWSKVIYNDALEKFNEVMRGDLDLSIDIAEAGQTAKMFRATDQVLDLTKTFTRKWGLLKAPASAWLQYTYGIKPLCQSVYGAAEEIIRINLNKSKVVKGRAKREMEIESVRVLTPIDGFVNVPVVSGRLKHSITIGCDVLTQDFDLARYTSLNPASIAWELMPYSFVVDWFINVGGYLRNLETAMLYASRFRSGYVSGLVAGDLKLERVLTAPYPGETYRFDRLFGDFKVTRLTRQVLSSYPAPNLPSLKAQLGSSRLLSAASLLANFLGRRH